MRSTARARGETAAVLERAARRASADAAELHNVEVVFCDIGDTLGTAVFSPPPQPHLERLDVFPFVADALANLRGRQVRIGVISNTGKETAERVSKVLEKAGLLQHFDPKLLIYSSAVGMQKDSPAIFALAADRAGLATTPRRCLFVGEDAQERGFAAAAGLRVARELTRIEHLLVARSAAPQVDLSNLPACVEDAMTAALDSDAGPEDPTNFQDLLTRLEAARPKLPPLYREAVLAPFLSSLNQLGPAGFHQILERDRKRQGLARLMLDIAQAILQNGEGFEEIALDGFEEVVSDLYDGFLSAEDRQGIKPPDNTVLAPLVKFGNPDAGPYTWPIDATTSFNLESAIVSLPPANAGGGLLAWAALGHEACGHDILRADRGLQPELANLLQQALQPLNPGLADYWSTRIDETSSDVMGILNMGPAAGIGLIGFFRGIRGAFDGIATLASNGPADDPHPADIVRGFLAASTVRLLSFDGSAEWANAIEAETRKDLRTITLAGMTVSEADARKSADIVAHVIAMTKTQTLGHALIEIQDWHNSDEDIVTRLRPLLSRNAPLDPDLAAGGFFAAHVVAAAVMAALAGDAQLKVLFSRMRTLLKAMHDTNPSWGPLFVRHPGSIVRDFAYGPMLVRS